jgi:hypothetical protein
VPNLLANFLTRTETVVNRSDKKDQDLMDCKEVVDIQDINKYIIIFLLFRLMFCLFKD